MRLLFALIIGLLPTLAMAQQQGTLVQEVPVSQASLNGSEVITTGLTYQLLFASSLTRRNFQIQNNNVSASTDVCYLLYGYNITSQVTIAANGTVTLTSTGAALTTSTNLTILNAAGTNTVTAAQASDVLSQYGAEGRYYPINPSDPYLVTCTTSSDSVSLHIQ
jgi:hypothetical protein